MWRFWNDRPSVMGDAQTAIEEVARMAPTLHSSVSRFRY